MKREKGTGSLYQASDKSWVYQYKSDGKRKTKRFRLKAEAKAFIDALDKENERMSVARAGKKSPQGEVVTVGEWLDRWLEKYAKPSVKLSTYCSYELYIRVHVKPQLGEIYINTLTVDNLQDFFLERGKRGNQKGDGGLAPKTLTNMRNMLHLAFSQAIKNKVIDDNPIDGVRLPKGEKAEMRVLTRNEQNRLIAAAKRAPEPAAFGIIFDLFTGLRIGELCGLRWENVDMEKQFFKVCETRNRLPNFDDHVRTSTSVKTVKTTKTENSRRTVYLMNSLLQDLQYYRDVQMAIMDENPGYNRDGYVFCQENGQPYEPRTYQDLFKRCIRQAGIADANFHSLRHTFATRALEQGMDIVTLSRLLGHATPSITLDKYGHALDDQKKICVEKLDAIYTQKESVDTPPTEETERNQRTSFSMELKF